MAAEPARIRKEKVPSTTHTPPPVNVTFAANADSNCGVPAAAKDRRPRPNARNRLVDRWVKAAGQRDAPQLHTAPSVRLEPAHPHCPSHFREKHPCSVMRGHERTVIVGTTLLASMSAGRTVSRSARTASDVRHPTATVGTELDHAAAANRRRGRRPRWQRRAPIRTTKGRS